MKSKYSPNDSFTMAFHTRRCYKCGMTPEAALEYQIQQYRRMTGEQRLAIALDLHELACDLAREGIRHQHPGIHEAEVERLLRERLKRARNS